MDTPDMRTRHGSRITSSRRQEHPALEALEPRLLLDGGSWPDPSVDQAFDGDMAMSSTLGAPVAISVSPAANSYGALGGTDVSVTYDQAIAPASATDQTFIVHAMQSGQLLDPPNAITVSGPSVAIDPDVNFRAGELVQATATTALASVAGPGPDSPLVWQFRVGTAASNGVFTDSGQALGSSHSMGVSLGDLDGDGDLDAFVANAHGGPNTIWLNNGSSSLSDSGQRLGSSDSLEVCLGDLDGDGDLDAFVVNGGGSNSVWLNDGAATFSDSGQSLGGSESLDVDLGDVDGDGDLDAFVANLGAVNTVWLNDGAGAFVGKAQPWGDSMSESVRLGDLDGDGDLDAFVANAGTGNTVWMNDGTGAFTDSMQRLGNSFSDGVSLGDLDGDGDLDAFVVNYFDGAADKVWLNDGTGAFADSGQNLGDSRGFGVCLGDLDGDGDLDAFVANHGVPNRIWTNDGGAAFSDSGQSLGHSGTEDVCLGDLDGDGDLDAFVANAASQPNKVWLNAPLVESDVDVWLVPRIVATHTDTSAILPTSDRGPFWQIEACDYSVEAWVRSDQASVAAISGGSVSLTFDPDYAQAVSVDHASVFTLLPVETVDNATGVVALGGTTLATDMGDDEYVCLGRVLFRGIGPVDEAGHEAGPYDMALDANAPASAFELVGVGSVDGDIQPVSSVDIRANIYDLGDNGHVDFDDFTYFAPAFGGVVGQTEPPFCWWADFDREGNVEFDDFTYFAAAYGKPFCDPTLTFPSWWNTTYVAQGDSQSAAIDSSATAGQVGDVTMLIGDLNADGRVSALDRRAFREAVGSAIGDPTYTPLADLNVDGRVSSRDRRLLRDHAGIPLASLPASTVAMAASVDEIESGGLSPDPPSESSSSDGGDHGSGEPLAGQQATVVAAGPYFPALLSSLAGFAPGGNGAVGIIEVRGGPVADVTAAGPQIWTLVGANQFTLGSAASVNHTDPQAPGAADYFGSNERFLTDTSTDDDHFQVLFNGTIEVPQGQGGDWTFGIRSHDGFILRLNGAQFDSAAGNAQLDLADPQTITSFGSPVVSESFGQVMLTEGTRYSFQLLFSEGTGSAAVELFAARGAYTSWSDTNTWRLVGGQSGLPLVAPNVTLTASFDSGVSWNVYEFHEGPVTWVQAHKIASASTFGGVKGHLATVHSDPENAFLRYLAGPNEFWIGLTDSGLFGGSGEGDWRWSSLEPFTYANWAPGEPNDWAPGEDGVSVLPDGLWNDLGIGADGQASPLHSYVIEYPIQSSDPPPGVAQELDPFFPDLLAELVSIAPGESGLMGMIEVDGWGITNVRDAGQNLIESVARGDFVAGIAPYVNHVDPEYPGTGQSFTANPPDPQANLPFLTDTPSNDDHFQVLFNGNIEVPPGMGGTWTIGVRSDDGYALRFANAHFGTVAGNAMRDPADPRTMSSPYQTSDSLSFGQVTLLEGVTYPFQLVFFEAWWSASVELFAAQGAHTSWGGSVLSQLQASASPPLGPQWRLLGDPDGLQLGEPSGSNFNLAPAAALGSDSSECPDDLCCEEEDPEGPDDTTVDGGPDDTTVDGPDPDDIAVSVVDLVVSGVGIDWIFERTYRSGVVFDGPLGHGWEFLDNARLWLLCAESVGLARRTFPDAKEGDVVRMDGRGGMDLFVWQDGTYEAPAGLCTTLVEDDEGYFTERHRRGDIVRYAPPDHRGLCHMTLRADPKGNTITYERDEQGRLRRAIDTLGRPIDYVYESDDPEARIHEVIDFSGRKVSFGYDDDGNLVSVTSPGDSPEGRTAVYTYSSGYALERLNHNLTGVAAPEQVAAAGGEMPIPWLTLTYETDPSSPDLDRVLTMSIGGTNNSGVPAGGTLTYEYAYTGPAHPGDFHSPVAQITVTDPNGNVTTHLFNQSGNILATTAYPNLDIGSGDPAFHTTTYSWDEAYLLGKIFPLGNSVTYEYDAGGCMCGPSLGGGNLLATTYWPDAVRGGDQTFLRTTFTREPIFNHVLTSTDPRGNDPAYVPPNGGPNYPGRYTTVNRYDFQESDNYAALAAIIGWRPDQADLLRQILLDRGVPMNLGDVNKDGRTDQIAGKLISVKSPSVWDGQTTQEIETLMRYNDSGQLIWVKDPQGIVTEREYFPATDPDGDGVPTVPADGRHLDPLTGGYLRQVRRDTDNRLPEDVGKNPPPTNIVESYARDELGNIVEMTDARGIITRYVVNAPGEVVETIRAAAHIPSASEPLPLVDFQYVERRVYNRNGQLVAVRVQDYGDTSGVGAWGDIDGDGSLGAEDIDALYDALGSPADSRLDLDFDGDVGQIDVDVLVRVILGTEFGDANLDGRVDYRDYFAFKYNAGSKGGGWRTCDFDGNGTVDRNDFLAIQDALGFSNPARPVPIAFADHVYRYDMLGNLVEELHDVNADKYLVTRYRYDAVGNRALTIFPELNANSTKHDHRDLPIQQTTGTHTPGNVLTSGVSSGGNTAWILRDTAQSWRDNEWAGRTLLIISGAGSGQVRQIASSTSDKLTVASPWKTVPDATSEYEISLTLLAPGDPIAYNVRGGIPSTTTFAYDGNGQLIETIDGDKTNVSPGDGDALLGDGDAATGDRTRRVYDGFGRLVSIVDAVGNQTVYQYDPAGNQVRVCRFGPVGGPSPKSDGPDVLPGPVSLLGVIQQGNLVNANLLEAAEILHDELSRVYQTDRVLFVNTIPTVRAPDVKDGAADLGKIDLTPGDNQPIPGVTGVNIIGRVTTRTEYDKNSRAIVRIEDDGDKYEMVYDGAGRVIRTGDPEGNTVESAYDDNGNLIETRETDYSFDETGAKRVDPEVFLTTYFYDSLDRCQQQTNNIGQTSFHRYDSRNNLVAMADAQGPLTGAAIARRAFPDGLLTINAINDFGNVTRYFYDGLNRPTRQEIVLTNLLLPNGSTYAGDGVHVGASIFGVKDTLPAPESFTPVPDPGQGGGGGIIRMGMLYDDNSLASALIDDNGNVTLYLYDNLNRRVAGTKGTTVFLANGTSAAGNTSMTLKDPTQNWEADKWADRQVRITGGQGAGQRRKIDSNTGTQLILTQPWDTIPDASSVYLIAAPLTKQTVLGPREIPTPLASTINSPQVIPAANIDHQLEKARQRLDAVAPLFPPLADRIDDNPPTTIVYGYSPDSNLLIMEDENDTEIFTRYDAVNRQTAVRVFRDGQTDSFAVDPLFAPVPSADPANPTDPSNPPVVVGTTTHDFRYDGLSRMTHATDNNDPAATSDDSVITFAYDSLGRLIEEAQQIGSLAPAIVSTAWRAGNLRSSMTYPDGRQIVYTYDRLDRLNTIADAGAAKGDEIADYDYIGPYRVLVRRHPQNHTRMTYLDDTGEYDKGYDGLRRPEQLRHLREDNSLIVGFTHAYDRMNNKLTEGKLHDAANSEVYTYDSAYQLIDFDRPNPGARAPLHSDWTLDGAGNWQQVVSTKSGGAVTGTRDHSSFNELIRQEDGAPIEYRYDDNGNQTDDGTFTFEWDYRNRLHTVTRNATSTTPEQLVAVYSYDAAGRRIRKVVTNSGVLDGTTDFYHDGRRVIEERNGPDDLVRQYVYGVYIDEPLVMDRNLGGGDTATGPRDQRLFYHQNALYSVFALTDDTGNVLESYLYDAYGRQTIISPGITSVVGSGADGAILSGAASEFRNPYTFTGRRYDPESQLYFYRARYYDAKLGRFIQRDPVGVSDGVNRYQYVHDNPVSNLDPSGRLSLGEKIGTIVTWRSFVRSGHPQYGLGNWTFDALFGSTYVLNDDENEMSLAAPLGVGPKMNQFYKAYLDQQSIPEGLWVPVGIPPQSAKKLVGQFEKKTKEGSWPDVGFWLHGSIDVTVAGGLLVCKKGGTYYYRGLYAEWQWHDDIDANSFPQLIGNKKASWPGVIFEGLWDLWQDKVRNVDFSVIVKWTDKSKSGEIYGMWPPEPIRRP